MRLPRWRRPRLIDPAWVEFRILYRTHRHHTGR